MVDFFKKLIDTPDSTTEFDATDIENNKVFSLLSYLWILFLVPLFAAKDSKYARFHANQGLVLFLVGLIGGAVLGVVGTICAFIPFVGGVLVALVGFVGSIFSLATTALTVLGIVNAVTGKAKELPIIGKFRIIK